MIQITQTAVLSKPDAIGTLAREFAETGCARLPGFLAAPVLQPLLKCLQTARFEVKNETHEGMVFGTTLFVPQDEVSYFLLHFVLNRPALFQIVERVAGVPRIGNFTGRLHRTSAQSNLHIDWHDDAAHTRVLGIAVNLGTEDYSGGAFQLRDPGGGMRADIHLAVPGDAFLFRIDCGWQHRLTTVETGSRTVGVGWFRTEPEWQSMAFTRSRIRDGYVSQATQT